MSNTTDEELREQIDDIFFKQYNALHDNFFHSEFEAAKAATVDVLALIHRTQLESRKEELEALRTQTREVTDPNAYISDASIAQSIRVHTNSLIEYRLAALQANADGANGRDGENSDDTIS